MHRKLGKRIWILNDNQKIIANILHIHETHLELLDVDGRKAVVPRSLLADYDRQFIEQCFLTPNGQKKIRLTNDSDFQSAKPHSKVVGNASRRSPSESIRLEELEQPAWRVPVKPFPSTEEQIAPFVSRAPVKDFKLSHDGSKMALLYEIDDKDSLIKIRDARSNSFVTQLRIPSRHTKLAGVTNDGIYVVTNNPFQKDVPLVVWTQTPGEFAATSTLQVDSVAHCFLLKSNRILLTTGRATTVRNFVSSRLEFKIQTPSKPRVSPDRSYFVVADASFLYFLDSANGNCLGKASGLAHNIGEMAFSPDGKRISFYYSYLDKIAVWELRSGKMTHMIKYDRPDSMTYTFSMDFVTNDHVLLHGRQLISLDFGIPVRLYEKDAGVAKILIHGDGLVWSASQNVLGTQRTTFFPQRIPEDRA